jgi:hypothetical protein
LRAAVSGSSTTVITATGAAGLSRSTGADKQV